MRNNIAPPPPTSEKTNVIYRFSCPYPHREAEDYIGLTSTSLNTRLTRHIQSGGIIKKHFEESHNIKPTKTQLLDNTTILTHAENRQILFIKEALLILQHAPKINRQYDNFTNVLKLYKSQNYNNNIPSTIPHSCPNSNNHSSITLNDPTLNNTIFYHQASPKLHGVSITY